MARCLLILSLVPILAATPAVSGEFEPREDELSVEGIVSTAAQCGDAGCFGALPLQPEVGLRLGPLDEVRVKFGMASGDGLSAESPFHIAPWAADLQADVKNVNGGNRSHLLTAWYRHTAQLPGAGTLETSVGIIDATDHLDGNVYSNDEYTQFMNSALVNGPNAFLPSYDPGLALSWAGRHWSARGVYMRVGENDDGNAFNFAGIQLGYRADTPLGEGNYRLLVDGADRRFYDPGGSSLEKRNAILLSCDQQLGGTVGAFVRLGRQTEDAAVDYGYLYSAGIDLRGGAWGRESDNIGLGYAYLGGGNGELRSSRVAEGYYRFAVNRTFSLTGDVQYMSDDREAGENPEGFILGLRVTAEF